MVRGSKFTSIEEVEFCISVVQTISSLCSELWTCCAEDRATLMFKPGILRQDSQEFVLWKRDSLVTLQSVSVKGQPIDEQHPTTGAYFVPAGAPAVIHATVTPTKARLKSVVWEIVGEWV
ncbi:hypothetical protein LAZ67_17001331 [Cordylochernes scorpioides]|uniref:Uncharacterized protein n=1 Tax=Cordylochernes scorpioides TaxID=51811 RepID=A0ABY6LH11_9ARAC|nr:hypothetical protein LAZ67_17001331 [Cordylochernes scorpioides]